eukprot:3775565-Rhodomonas_salina.1
MWRSRMLLPCLVLAWAMTSWVVATVESQEVALLAAHHWVQKRLRAWGAFVKSRGFTRAEILDEDEALFASLDPSPLQRQSARGSLREYLQVGQEEWKKDGGVVHEDLDPDPALLKLWPFIWNSWKRQPKGVVSMDMDVREYVRRFWELSDFDGAPEE